MGNFATEALRTAARSRRGVALVAALCALAAPPVRADAGDFELEIQSPSPAVVVSSEQSTIAVEGRASMFGGVRKIDLFLVMDTSKSLRKSDPQDHRSAGAIGLVRSLSWSPTNIGVVDFDKRARIAVPLTGDRAAVIEAIRALDQFGRTDLADGIQTALEGFAQGGRPDAVRVMLVFTDGKSKEDAAREAIERARAAGVLVSTLQLGRDRRGRAILQEIAERTGGRFVAVTDPEELSDAFLDLRSTGLDRVELSVNGGEPVLASVAGGRFSADVPLGPGENRIVARATSVDGRRATDELLVTVRSPGCASLSVTAVRDGRPALSISERAVELVVDASGSMWGRMDGRTKIEVAREILADALAWLPADLDLSLRAYGHRFHRDAENCEDTELLVAPGAGNRAEIRAAIRSLNPQGQTPLGYALGQVAADLDDFAGERAVVLVTDGIESCGGDAPSAARALQAHGSIPVHVIGFGLDGRGDGELAGLRAIADASGGRFLTAGSASALRDALGATVGTPFRVLHGGVPIARGTLGSGAAIRLPAGDYEVAVESAPPVRVPVALGPQQDVTLTLRRDGGDVAHGVAAAPAAYAACDAATVADLLAGEGAPGAAESGPAAAPSAPAD